MHYVEFMTDETPHACWDHDLAEKNLEFLNGIDAEFFRYTALVHAEKLDSEDKHRAAIAIRIAYSHAVETLFALLCAMVQAPCCVVGWMSSYRNAELDALVDKINAEQVIYSRLHGAPLTWEVLAALVHSDLPFGPDRRKWIQDGFGRVWSRWGHKFTNRIAADEYNGAKHGLRTKAGGFTLSAGIEESPGVEVPPEKMQVVGGSEFGTTFFRREKIAPDDRLNFRPARMHRNWDPVALAQELLLLSMSINNVVSFLKAKGGAPQDRCKYVTPATTEAFDAPWKHHIVVGHMGADTVLTPQHIQPRTKENVIDSYKG